MKRLSLFLVFSLIVSGISALPSVKTGNEDIDNLVQLAQTEVQKNIRPDGTFCAGEKWPTAWTRDMSYAIDLSLSFLFPEAVGKSLDSRIENETILQDTGSGGSYPVSTDRITWITAAYDYALIKQSPEYFNKIYKIAKNVLEKDYNINFDSEKQLFRGESSFLDWREQTYPRWATNEYIAESYALGTNMMYYSALQKIISLAEITNADDSQKQMWIARSEELKKAILQNFWIPEKKYFAALLLKDIDTYRYEGYETLGESLGVLLNIAPQDNFKNVIGAVKPQAYGLSVVAPQLANIPPYHNNGVWPFVQGYRGLACKKAKDAFNAQFEFEAMIKAAKKFGTFKENYVASDFSPDTQINSNRQLWSDAGFLGYVYKVMFGISFEKDGLHINPFVFSKFNNEIKLENLSFNGNSLSLTVKGNGDLIKSYLLNEKKVDSDYVIPYTNNEKYNIVIEMTESEDFKNSYIPENQIKPWFEAAVITPAVPNTRIDCDGKTTEISFKPKNKGGYKIITDSKEKITSENNISIKPGENIILNKAFALPENGDTNIPLFPSKEVRAENTKNTVFYEAENAVVKGGTITEDKAYSYSEESNEIAKLSEELIRTEANANNFVKDFGKEEGEYIEFTVKIKKNGKYAVDFRFKNGHGPINTGEKCAVLAVSQDDKLVRRLAFPQQGAWSTWSFTAPTVLELNKGTHKIKLYTDNYCRTQHDALNPVYIDLMRIAKIK